MKYYSLVLNDNGEYNFKEEKMSNVEVWNINDKLIKPKKYVTTEEVDTISGFQNVRTSTEENLDYYKHVKEYLEKCIVIVPELADLKTSVNNALLNIKTDRTAELLVLKHRINQASSITELQSALQNTYDAIMDTPRGSGSRLAESVQSLLEDDFVHYVVKSDMPVDNGMTPSEYEPTYQAKREIIKLYIENEKKNEPAPSAVNNKIDLTAIAKMAEALKKTDPKSSGLKKISAILQSQKSDDEKIMQLQGVATSSLNAKQFLSGAELQRSPKLKDFYVYLAAGDQASITKLQAEIVKDTPSTPRP